MSYTRVQLHAQQVKQHHAVACTCAKTVAAMGMQMIDQIVCPACRLQSMCKRSPGGVREWGLIRSDG